MRVIDDFLGDAAFLRLRAAVLAPGFPWERSAVISGADLPPQQNRQLVHGFRLRKPGLDYSSPRLGLLDPVLARLQPRELVKAKVNLTPRQAGHVAYGLHVDTRWKFQEMYLFRDFMARASGMQLLVHTNPEAIERDINPFDHGSALHTDVTKTEGLKQALDLHQFDVVFGGARRDEEKSRAKERVFSFRSASHRWDPKNQRPELWNLYNTRKNPGESIRVFPLSNWTELDVWQYIYEEGIPVVPLYFAKPRAVVARSGTLMMVDDERCRLLPGEEIEIRKVRFRTLGCYPLTGAVESDADTLQDILQELIAARQSERQGRMIDSDSAGSMEKKKKEGYF